MGRNDGSLSVGDVAAGAVRLQNSPDQPASDRKGEPYQCGEYEHHRDGGMRNPEPEHHSKTGEAYAAEGGTERVECGKEAAAPGAIRAYSFLVELLVSFDERSARGKDCGKSEEEATHFWAVRLRNETGDDTDGSAEEEANDPLVQLDAFDRGESGVDDHGYLATNQRAKETANHTGRRPTVAARAGGLRRRRSQLAASA
jgi:hypothetical protein